MCVSPLDMTNMILPPSPDLYLGQATTNHFLQWLSSLTLQDDLGAALLKACLATLWELQLDNPQQTITLNCQLVLAIVIRLELFTCQPRPALSSVLQSSAQYWIMPGGLFYIFAGQWKRSYLSGVVNGGI